MNAELEGRVALSMVELYQGLLSPEHMREMAITSVAWQLYLWMADNAGKGDWDPSLEELVTASSELLDLTKREGMNADAFHALWMDRYFWSSCPALGRIRQRIADLAQTFTADSTEAGPLFDFARGLGAGDG